MVTRSKELQWRCYSTRGNVPSKRLISLQHLCQNVDQISFKIMTKLDLRYLEKKIWSNLSFKICTSVYFDLQCSQSFKAERKSVAEFGVLRCRGGSVANRGLDSWDIWAPGWSYSHQQLFFYAFVFLYSCISVNQYSFFSFLYFCLFAFVMWSGVYT